MWLSVFWIIGGSVALAQSSRSAWETVPNNAWFGEMKYAQGVWVTWAGNDQWEWLVEVIKNAINWVLGILSLITFVLLLWWGFQMVTAAGDDGKYKAWFKILKQAWIGLAFIATSWLIVSLIFFVISSAWAGWEDTTSQTYSAAWWQ